MEPTIGESVKVLHGDSVWYPGKLTAQDPDGQWHVEFEDGDKAKYRLPHSEVRIVPSRASGSWSLWMK